MPNKTAQAYQSQFHPISSERTSGPVQREKPRLHVPQTAHLRLPNESEGTSEYFGCFVCEICVDLISRNCSNTISKAMNMKSRKFETLARPEIDRKNRQRITSLQGVWRIANNYIVLYSHFTFKAHDVHRFDWHLT